MKLHYSIANCYLVAYFYLLIMVCVSHSVVLNQLPKSSTQYFASYYDERISSSSRGSIHAVIGYYLNFKRPALYTLLKENFGTVIPSNSSISGDLETLSWSDQNLKIHYYDSSKSSFNMSNIIQRLEHVHHSVLIINEPFKGLTYSQERGVAFDLVKISKMGHNILILSQPVRSSLCSIFDELSLFVRGKILFRGAVSQMAAFFSSIGLPCPNHLNPVQYYSSIVTADHSTASTAAKCEQAKRLESIFHRRLLLETTHRRKLSQIINRARRKEAVSNIFRHLIRRGVTLIPSEKTVGSAAGWYHSTCNNFQQKFINGSRSLQQLHSLSVNASDQSGSFKGAIQLSSAFSLSALTLGYANLVFGMSMDGPRIVLASSVYSIATVLISKTCRSMIPFARSSGGATVSTDHCERRRDSSSLLSELASKISLPSIYPCINALLAQNMDTSSSMVMFVFIMTIKSLVGALLRICLPALIPVVKFSTIAYAPPVLALTRSVRMTSIYSSLSMASSTPKRGLKQWLSQVSRSIAMLTLTRVCALASSKLHMVGVYVIRGMLAVAREILPRIPFLLACSGHLRGAGDLANYLLEFVPVKLRTLSFSRYLLTDSIDHHHTHSLNESIRIIGGNGNREKHHVSLGKIRRFTAPNTFQSPRRPRILYRSANFTPKNYNFMSPFLTADIHQYLNVTPTNSCSFSSKKRRVKGRKLTYRFSFLQNGQQWAV